MKLTLLLTLAACLQVSARGFAQTITLSEKNASLEKIFREIRRQTGYDFFYQSELLIDARNIDIKVTNLPLAEALAICFRDQPLTFTIAEKTILIRAKAPPAPKPAAETPPPPMLIKGRIVDDKSGEPVIGASVMVKGSDVGVTTGREGDFIFAFNGNEKPTLIISHIGYITKEIALAGKEFASKDFVTIRLAIADQSMAAVEISTGMFKRNKESFTGVVTSFTGDQLKTIGNKNIIESLKTLDPSFIVVENNRIGSNPNSLPTIELRGKTSIAATSTTTTNDLRTQYTSDPNLPLFVLNGFPTTLEIVNNLDMNRVATITILKDAASTAIWGSKAANGVIVIETKKPIAGELLVGYTGDFSVSNPDLTSYNLMNAAEKLQFENLAGVYTDGNQYTLGEGLRLYNQRLADVRRGVNTYWLNEPVRTGFINHHSLQLTGGNNDLLFGAALSWQKETGVMKGSDKSTWSANIELTYRKGKLNITNQLYLSGYTGNESPYGSFADFAATNPLLTKRRADGSMPRYADSTTDAGLYSPGAQYLATSFVVPNPLYNASLYSINKTNNLDIRDNVQAILTLAPQLWLQGGFQITTGTTTQVIFTSPENTAFDAFSPTEKGAYTNDQSKVNRYDGNLMLTYAKTFVNAHMINFNLRSDITQQRGASTGFKVIGFPEGTNGNPAFGFKYDPYSTAPASTAVTRSFGNTAAFSYAYKMRYLLDAVYTLSGTNAFGSNNKYKPSWSVGLGWNLHQTSYFRQFKWISKLSLHGNIGLTGNELLGTYSSNSVYTAVAGSNVFGQSLDQTQLGNPNLQWQNTKNLSTSMDFNLLNNRVSGTVSYYVKTTDPLILGATGILPASAGLQFAYPINVGKLVYKGWEANLRVSPIYKLKERIVWTLGLTGAKVDGKYSGFGNTLYAANKELTTSNGLTRFMDGYSPDDIWAVRSKGIDPASGREIFLKKNGDESFFYNADDIVRVGNSRPKIEGVISSSLTYKGLFINVGVRYRLNGYQMNTALYNKVENITIQGLKFNQDKRALYDRWQKPGDISQFKGIAINDYTPISSRFIQKDSHLIGESFSFGWDFTGSSWIHLLKMQSLRIGLYTNDIFRLTSIKTERGLDYPFALSASLSIAAYF